jgi:demethylsterigmatocystin 6-O-methyltransferase
MVVQPLQVALLRVGINLDLFQTLMKSEGPVTLDDLVNKTGASKQLLSRSPVNISDAL